MRNSLLIHGIWVLVAAAAFVVGKMQSSDSGSSSTGGEGGAKSEHRTGQNPDSRSVSGPGGRRAGSATLGDDDSLALDVPLLSADQMTHAMATVMAETDPIKRQRMFTRLLAALTPENAEAAVKALQDAPRSRWNWGQEFSLLTYAWGRIDGNAAVAYAKKREGRSREWTMASVLAGWASNEPEKAMDWVKGIEDPKERGDFTRGLIYGLAQRDVAGATSYVLKLSEAGNERSAEYMGALARHQLSQGVDTAAEWTDSLPDGKLKGSAMHTVASEFVRRDPAKAAAWAEQYAENDFAVRAIAEISEEWAEDDPAGSLEWVTTLPEGSSRMHALGETVSEWARKDPTEAGEYLGTLPQGDERDFAVSAYVRRVANEDPVTSLEWAQTISSPKIRDHAVVRNVREWISRDAQSAYSWLETANLSEAAMAEIKKPRDPSGRSDYHRRR